MIFISWATHWFKLEIEIPHEWVGREVRLVWDSESEALIWRDGEPIQVKRQTLPLDSVWFINSGLYFASNFVDNHMTYFFQGLSSELKRIYYVLSKKFDPVRESRWTSFQINVVVRFKFQNFLCRTTLYIEMACNKVLGVGDGDFIKPPKSDKQFTLRRAEILIFDRKVYDLLLDFEVLIDIIKVLKMLL